MSDIEQSGFGEFDRWIDLVGRTREVLDAAIDDGAIPPAGADYLTDRTLPHVEGLQAGFVGSLRSESVGLAELRYLIGQAAATRSEGARDEKERRAAAAEEALEQALRERGLRQVPRILGIEPWNLAALAHARVVLAFLPRLPDEQVRFPAGRRSYADIAAPRGPAELAERIEELERQLWRMLTRGRPDPVDPGFRRTYGFFDAADRLGLRAFGSAA